VSESPPQRLRASQESERSPGKGSMPVVREGRAPEPTDLCARGSGPRPRRAGDGAAVVEGWGNCGVMTFAPEDMRAVFTRETQGAAGLFAP
jgi:hypothetical protein